MIFLLRRHYKKVCPLKSRSPKIRSLTLRCELLVFLFEMFRVIGNRSNASVAMTSRVLDPSRGTFASFRSSLHSGSRTTRAYTTRWSSALESPKVIRCHAKLRFYIETEVSHWYTLVAIITRASLYLLPQFRVLCNFIKIPRISIPFPHICNVSRNFLKATDVLI